MLTDSVNMEHMKNAYETYTYGSSVHFGMMN